MPTTPLPDAAGVVKIRIRHLVQGQEAVQVWHAKLAGADPSTLVLFQTATNMIDEWQTFTMPNLSNVVQLASIEMTVLTSPTSPQVTAVSETMGGASAPLTDAARALCVTIRSALRTRSGRGRTYFPGFPDNVVADPRHWTTTTASNGVAIMEHFDEFLSTLDPSVNAPMHIGVLSYYSGTDGAGRPIRRTTPVFNPAVSYTCDTRIDSQRRRLGRS